MARRKNSNDIGPGLFLLILIIGFIAYIGPVLLVIGAVVGVIYLISRAGSNNTTGTSSVTRENTSATTKSTSGTSVVQTPLVQASTRQAGSTTYTSDKDAEIVQKFKSKYYTATMSFPAAQGDPLQSELGSFQCAEVLQTVNRLVNQRITTIKQLNTYSKEIDAILACPNCYDNKAKAKYLQEHESELNSKLSEYNILKGKMKMQKITLMNKHDGAFSSMRNAVLLIQGSKKIRGTSGVDFKTFAKLKSSIPGDLFTSDIQPIELNFGIYRFFLLPEVILVYDKAGVFATALEPMAMVITSKTEQKNVSMSRDGYSGTWRHSDSIIGDDSMLMREGSVTTTWLHTKKDGGPDRRYSHNPMYQYRSDVYQYSVVTIQIGQYKAEYSISAGNISAKIKSMVREYTSIMHELNATPSLLRLLEAASKKKGNAQELYTLYEKSNPNFICKS